jgi:very-short-patch-repair endonuclease
MRKELTDAELKFWNAIRAHRLMGLSFRRQMPINGYIVDFACPAHKLVIEIDGSTHSHDRQIIKDRERDGALTAIGWTVVRITNHDIILRLDEVCTHILRVIEQNSVHAFASSP